MLFQQWKVKIQTFGNNVTTKDKHQQQGERSNCVCNNLSSSESCNETKQGKCHLMYTEKCQELFEEPIHTKNLSSY